MFGNTMNLQSVPCYASPEVHVDSVLLSVTPVAFLPVQYIGVQTIVQSAVAILSAPVMDAVAMCSGFTPIFREHVSPSQIEIPQCTPSWITSDLVAETINVLGPFYPDGLSVEEAIDGINSVGLLFDVLEVR